MLFVFNCKSHCHNIMNSLFMLLEDIGLCSIAKPYHCYHQFLVIFSQLCFVYFLVRCKLTDLVMVINSTIAEDQKDPGREDCTAKFSHWRRFFWASNRRCSQWSNTWWNPSFNLEAKLRTEVCWYLLQYE